MTIGTPAPAGLALASYERPVGVNPPLNYPAYRSTALRAPRRPLPVMPQGLTEVTGPLLGRERVIAADADLTTQHEGEPIGERIIVTGRVLDSDGRAVPDTLIEIWQADPDGRFDHPGDPRGRRRPAEPSFRGFGRCLTAPNGSYRIVTLKPGPLPGPDGGAEAPHIDVSMFARGLLDRLVTRVYFPDEPAANRADPVLRAVADPGRRATLIAAAQPGPPGGFRFDIHLQGDRETVFFDV
jgi:protocatechuate 3,4-dioxygenase beta subunit